MIDMTALVDLNIYVEDKSLFLPLAKIPNLCYKSPSFVTTA